MNGYEQRLEAKRERMRAAAEKRDAAAAAARKVSDAILSAIPPGQPILVGHHSEKRHRKALDRSWNLHGKAIRLEKEAGDLRQRAESVGTAGISSDDPEAAGKLGEQVSEMRARRARMVFMNKAWRSAKGDLDKFAALAKIDAGAAERIAQRIADAFSWEKQPFPKYVLANLSNNLRRYEQRLAVTAVPKSAREAVVGNVRIAEEDNRVRLRFPGKPAAEVRTLLKSRGFRWSPLAGAWQRHQSEMAWQLAQDIAAKIGSQATP